MLVSQVAFAALVVATVGAFFVTTRLKRSPAVVQGLTFARYLSPNGDGRQDVAEIAFRTKRADEVTVSMVADGGDEVKTLVQGRELAAGRHRVRWDGSTDVGVVAPDGRYRVRVRLRRQRRSVISPRSLVVDMEPPELVVRYVSPDVISPGEAGGAGRARLRFDGPLRNRPTLLVYRTDLPRPRLVARRRGRRGSAELSWDGLVGAAGRMRPASTGNYLLVVRTRDAAGNAGPAELPPTPDQVRGHPGVLVRYVAAVGPRKPVSAGAVARFEVAAERGRYRWSVRRLGSSRTLDRGSSRSAALHLRAPRGRSGVFLLDLRAGRHRYQVPFVVQAQQRHRVLVVLPATTWEARNPLDADGDGFGDVLARDGRVSRGRPFAGGGLPPGFASDGAPLLTHLDSSGLRYDVTTDLALSADDLSDGRSGVVFAGPPRFLSADVGRLLRRHVERGGRLAWVGTGGFRYPVRVTSQAVETLARSRGRNMLGERLRTKSGDLLLTVLGDRIEFFTGVGGALGPFPRLEESQSLPQRARLLASAGHEANRPALVVYRLGRGVVVRIGVDGFGRAADSSPGVARIMRRLWTLLSQ